MLAFDELDTLSDPILELYEVYIQSVLKEIARRLRGMKLTSSTAWMMQRLTESGLIYEHALKELEKLTGLSETELRRAFRKAGVLATRFDETVYRAAGLKPLPLNLSPAMTQVLAAGLRKTGGVMRNLTMTTALSAQNLFIEAADLAYMQVTSGAFDYISAIRDAVEHVARKGLTVIRFPGRSEQLDVAMRRVVLTGIGQTTGELQLTRAQEMGMNLMQVSAHIGARNKGTGPMNHESWQGKVYSIVGSTPEYPNLYEVTGLGTVEGLHGVNCRHSMYPFYEGLSEKLYTQKELDEYANQKVVYQGKEMSVYEATQQQRAIERKIREWKRKEGALDAAGLDHEGETAKVREWQARMRAFVKETGLIRQGERERVYLGDKPKKTIGFSFLSGDTNLITTQDAIDLGNSENGWDKHEKIFRENYLEPFKLKDDVERTIGYWGGPEPSFNGLVKGSRENFIEMAKQWGRDFNQQAMAVLIPEKKASGGKIILEMPSQLSSEQWDQFFQQLTKANEILVNDKDDYIGVTTKVGKIIEYWFENSDQRDKADLIFRRTLQYTSINAKKHIVSGYEFKLLFRGRDY